MVVLGIDPGYAIVGYGVVEIHGQKLTPIQYGAIRTAADLPITARLREIYDDMTHILDAFNPDCVAMERLYFNTNEKTAINVSQARGVLLLACEQAEKPVFEYTPLQVKMSVVGYGRAEKRQVMEMTQRILSLKEIPKPDDAADALAIAVCHAHTARNPLAR